MHQRFLCATLAVALSLACRPASAASISEAAPRSSIELDLPEIGGSGLRALSPDKKRLFAMHGPVVSAWDLQSGALLWRKEFPESMEHGGEELFAVSGDGALLAVGLAFQGRGKLRVWSAADGAELRTLRDSGLRIGTIAFQPGTSTLLVRDQKALQRYDAQTGARLPDVPLPPFEDRVTLQLGPAFGADPNLVFVERGDSSRLETLAVDLKTGALIRSLRTYWFQLAGSTLLVYDNQEQLFASYHLPDFKPLQRWAKIDFTYNGGSTVRAAPLSPDGQSVAFAVSGGLRVESAVRKKVLFRTQGGDLSWSDDGELLSDGREVWSVKARKAVPEGQAADAFLLQTWSPLAARGPDGPVRLRRMVTSSAAVSADGRYLALQASEELRVLDFATGAFVYRAPLGWNNAGLRFSGQRLLVLPSAGGARVLEPEEKSGGFRVVWEAPKSEVLHYPVPALAEDGNHLVIATRDPDHSGVSLIDLASPAPRALELPDELAEGLIALLFSSNGQTVLLGTYHGVWLFSTATGALLKRLDGEPKGTLADGRFLLMVKGLPRPAPPPLPPDPRVSEILAAEKAEEEASRPVFELWACDGSGNLERLPALDFLVNGAGGCARTWSFEGLDRGSATVMSDSRCESGPARVAVVRGYAGPASAAPKLELAAATAWGRPVYVHGPPGVRLGESGVELVGPSDGAPRGRLLLLGDQEWALVAEDGRYAGTKVAPRLIHRRVEGKLVPLAPEAAVPAESLWRELLK